MPADRLSLATQTGGQADGWPEDVWSLIVWAAIGSGDWPDATPHADIADQRARGGDPEAALEALSFSLVQQPAPVVLAAAWAGLARYALARRDAAIRANPPAVSARQLAQRVGLSHVAVGTIRRPR